jgi:ribosomal protein L3
MSTFERNLKGLLGTKLGMTQTWDENNRIVPVTVIAAGTNVVTQVRTPEKDGYNAIQIGKNAFRFFDKFIFPIISGVNYWRSWLFRTQGRGNYG